MKLISVDKTYFKNNEEVVALKNINVEFENVGLYLIYGQSGSGKTTLLNIISGLDNITKGSIINEYGNDACSFIFQDYQLIEYLTIYENLKYICDLYGVNYELINTYANKYGLANILNHYPNEVSGGEKQRAAIIRSFLSNKPIILCDEPTGNLDEENALIIANALKEQSRTHIVIVVSHDKELFEKYCTQMIRISKGEIVEKTIITSTEKMKQESLKPINFNIKNQLYIMSKFLKRNYVKHLFLIITLILAFFLAISALSTVSNSYSKVLNKVSRDQNESQIDFAKSGINDTFKTQKYEDLINEAKKYDSDTIFYDYGFFQVGNVYPNRTYIGNKTANHIICGINRIVDNEIVISDYIALKTGLSFDELINSTYSGFKIVGVYDTGFYNIAKDLSQEQIDNLEIDSDFLEKKYSSLYINYNTFEAYLKNSEEFSSYINISGYKAGNYVLRNWTGQAMYGEVTDLDDGEVGISIALAKEYAENYGISLDNLIGKQIEIKSYLTNNQYEKATYYSKFYTVKYICSGSSHIMRTVISTNNYIEGSLLYNYEMTNYTNGISISNYNTKIISKILNAGYEDCIAITAKISDGIEWLNTLKYIEIGICVIMLIISTIVLINFVHGIFEKEKAVQGLLISFGIKKNKIIFMYLLEISILVILSIIISLFLQIPFIFGINKILISYIGSFGVLYFESLSIIYIILILIVLLFIIYLILTKKMNKKQIIDIIYQR